MFACMGYIVPEYFKFPGELSPKLGLKFSDIPNGLAALTKAFCQSLVNMCSNMCIHMCSIVA